MYPDRTLFDGANWDRLDALAAMGFEQGLGIDTVGLAAASIGLDLLCGDNFGLCPWACACLAQKCAAPQYSISTRAGACRTRNRSNCRR